MRHKFFITGDLRRRHTNVLDAKRDALPCGRFVSHSGPHRTSSFRMAELRARKAAAPPRMAMPCEMARRQ